jgi:hypothetical protein
VGSRAAAPGLGALVGRVRAVLDAGLFPPARPRRWPPAAVAAGYLTAFVGGSVLLATWMPHLAGHVWAEDGGLFLAQAKTHIFAWTLLHPYANYMHAVPRLITAVIVHLPLSQASRGFVVASAVVRAALALFVFRASAGHLRSVFARGLIAAAFVALPLASQETLDNVANLHWFFIAAAFWALLWRPRSAWEIGLATAVVVLSVDSDPLSIILLPLVVLRLFALPRWRDRAVAIGFIAAGVVQAAVTLHTRIRSMADQPPDALFALRMFGARVWVGMFGGVHNTTRWYGHWHWTAIVVFGLLLVALISPAFVSGGPRAWVPGTAVVLGCCLFLFTTRYADAPLLNTLGPFLSQGGRYSVVPALLLWYAVAAGLDGVISRSVRSLPLLAGRLAVVAALVWSVVADHGTSIAGRTSGPSWQQALRDGSAACATTRQPTVLVAISPPGWAVKLPCSQLGPRQRAADAEAQGHTQ